MTTRYRAEDFERLAQALEALGAEPADFDGDIVVAVLRQAAETERARTWQPMETAPKGKPYIGGLFVNGELVDIHLCSGGWIRGNGFITHWMPLPAPPGAGGEE